MMEQDIKPVQTVNKLPLVTVIIATYNSSKTLSCSIESLLYQDFTDFEAWIIGDCCTDDSESVVRSFEDKRLNWYNLPVNSGTQAGPNTEGLRRAQGSYIAYLGHDDLWFPNHLTRLVQHLEAGKADFVHCFATMITPKGAVRIIGPPANGNYQRYHVPPSCWLYKKSVEQAGVFWQTDPYKINQAVDIDYTTQIARAGLKISFLPGQMVAKFPSAEWGLYSRTADFPQVRFLQAIKENPDKVAVGILYDLALVLNKLAFLDYSVKKSFKALLHSIFMSLLNFYSFDRWPLKQLYIYKSNKYRRKRRIVRGLKS